MFDHLPTTIDDVQLMIDDSPYRIRHSISNLQRDIEILKDVPTAGANNNYMQQ